jgi:hypothetical protein
MEAVGPRKKSPGGAPKLEKRPDVGSRRAVEVRHDNESIGRKPTDTVDPVALLPGPEREPGSVRRAPLPGVWESHRQGVGEDFVLAWPETLATGQTA